MAQTVSIYDNAKEKLIGTNSTSEIWISDPQVLPNSNDKKYSVLFFPSTGSQAIVERTYFLGVLQKPNLSKLIASKNKNSAVWTPNEDYDDQQLIQTIKRNQSTSKSFNDSVDKTISTAFAIKNQGQQPTKNQISRIKSGESPTQIDDEEEDSKDEIDKDVSQDQLNRSSITEEETALNDTFSNLSTLTNSIKENSAAKRSDVNGLSYPENFPEGMDYIIFEAKKYGTKTFDTKSFGFDTRTNISIEESVQLPIQPSISDSNSVGWNEQTFNPAQVIGSSLAVGGITGGIKGFMDNLDSNIKTAQTNPADISSAIIAYFTQQATGAQILPKMGGAIFNPNTELLFQGPQLRPFNFTFKLSPRSKTEADRVLKIISFFKRNMAAKTTSSQLYLKSPNVFGIKYYLNDKEHPGINLIKDCALQSCVVNYTTEGSYMAFKDGSMTSYEINLQFMELEPIYASDYDSNDAKSHLIGY